MVTDASTSERPEDPLTRVTFVGDLIPHFATVGLVVDLPWEVTPEQYGGALDAKVQMIGGRCAVTFFQASPHISLENLYGIARRLATDALDYAAYATCVPLQLSLTTRVVGDGTLSMISPQVDGVLPDNEGPLIEHTTWQRLLQQSPAVRHALRDFRLALAEADDTMFYLNRCLECMRNEFDVTTAGAKADRRRAWRHMQASLRYEREWTAAVEAAGKEQRHGDHRFGSHHARVEALGRVRTILTRFLLWISSGRQPLSASEYPTLISAG